MITTNKNVYYEYFLIIVKQLVFYRQHDGMKKNLNDVTSCIEEENFDALTELNKLNREETFQKTDIPDVLTFLKLRIAHLQLHFTKSKIKLVREIIG